MFRCCLRDEESSNIKILSATLLPLYSIEFEYDDHYVIVVHVLKLILPVNSVLHKNSSGHIESSSLSSNCIATMCSLTGSRGHHQICTC